MNLAFLFTILLIVCVLFEYFQNDFKFFETNKLSETQVKIIKEILYFLVMEAEATFGSGTGETKFAFVIHKFYSSCPDFLKKIISQNNFNVEEMIIEFLEESVNRMRKYFIENPLVKGMLEERKI